MLKATRYIGLFLIVFGLFGYVVCIPIAVLGNSAISAIPSLIEDGEVVLANVRGGLAEIETTLHDLSSDVSSIVDAVSAFNFTRLDYEVNATLTSMEAMLNETDTALLTVRAMLNETGTTLQAVVTMLNENAEMMALFANSSGIQTIAPEIAVEAGNLAVTMRATADVVQTVPINSTINALDDVPFNATVVTVRALRDTARPILRLLEDVKTDLVTRVDAVQTYLDAFIERLDDVTQIIDVGSAGLTQLKASGGLLRVGLIAILGYLLCLHSAFLLTGIVIRKTSSDQ
jgi:hypothetical protein